MERIKFKLFVDNHLNDDSIDKQINEFFESNQNTLYCGCEYSMTTYLKSGALHTYHSALLRYEIKPDD